MLKHSTHTSMIPVTTPSNHNTRQFNHMCFDHDDDECSQGSDTIFPPLLKTIFGGDNETIISMDEDSYFDKDDHQNSDFLSSSSLSLPALNPSLFANEEESYFDFDCCLDSFFPMSSFQEITKTEYENYLLSRQTSKTKKDTKSNNISTIIKEDQEQEDHQEREKEKEMLVRGH